MMNDKKIFMAKLLEYNKAIVEAEVDLSDSWHIYNVCHMSDKEKVEEFIKGVEFSVFVGILSTNRELIDFDFINATYDTIHELFIEEIPFEEISFEKFEEYKKYVYFLRDEQEANLGNIENELFYSIDEILQRLCNTYFSDYGIYTIDNPKLSLKEFYSSEYEKLKNTNKNGNGN